LIVQPMRFSPLLRQAIIGMPALGLMLVASLGLVVGTRGPVPQRLVAEAPIWGPQQGAEGYAYLPVTLQGHAVAVVVNLRWTRGDLSLSPAALMRAGIPLPDTMATSLDSLRIGTDLQRDVPWSRIKNANWSADSPPHFPSVVGVVGVHFLTTHYDVLYDFPGRSVHLYAFPSHPVQPREAWMPPGFTPNDCGRMIPIPPGAATFTGVAMQVDGHPVTGVLEMGLYYPKMNQAALAALQLPADSPRIDSIPADVLAPGYTHGGHPVTQQVMNVHLTVGSHTFWAGPVQIFPVVDVETLLSPHTPVMLLNLSNIQQAMLFNATSSGQVCIGEP
jgi:hypothetical protein